MDDFWESIGNLAFDPSDTEAVVETRLVMPLLQALGYDRDRDIIPKKSVQFQQGRNRPGRPNEADFVLYDGPIKNRNTSLIVLEAKRPTEKLENGIGQAESYAAALKTPVFILTNGLRLEIWQVQLSGESKLALECTTAELAAKRGAIESLISKQAVIAHCKGLWSKDFALSAGETTAYIEAELTRTSWARPFVQRNLSREGNQQAVTSSELLPQFPGGAMITGPSGFGKTELADHLFRSALSAHESLVSRKLPVEVRLTDVTAEGSSILQYASTRIQAHCPQITNAKFDDILRDNGAVIICDGLERVQASCRARVVAEIAAIRRDKPKVDLFIFSRRSSVDDVCLPILEIEELNYEQRHEFAKTILEDVNYVILNSLTGSLASRLGHPIFMKLICEYYNKFKSHPSTLSSLFDEWLERVLKWCDPTAAIQVQRECALSLLAERTLFSPVTKAEAFRVLREAGFGEEVFNALVESDALDISQNTVELVHEALADHLRAKHLASLSFENFISALKQVTFHNDSLLATLLMGQIPQPPYQRALWKRLCESGAREYLGTFKFRADASQTLLAMSDEMAQAAVLEDILDGFEDPATAFFPELWDEICLEEIGSCDCFVAIEGGLSAGLSDVFYSLRPRAEHDARVVIGRAKAASRRRGVNLLLSRMKPDSGRAIGTGILLEALKTIVEARKLNGGPALSRERLVSRIRFLVEEMSFPEDCVDIMEIIEKLKPRRNYFIKQSSKQVFYIEDLISDANACVLAGDASLDRWWSVYMRSNGQLDVNNTAQALIATYERAEAIFSEIIEHSFTTVRDEFEGYLVRPIQWRLQVNNAGGGAWPLETHWFPIEGCSQPKAIVEVVSKPHAPDWCRGQRAHYDNVIKELQRLGRRSDVRISTSSSHLPQFNGYTPSGGFTGETPAMSMAHEWVMRELETLFSDFPSRP